MYWKIRYKSEFSKMKFYWSGENNQNSKVHWTTGKVKKKNFTECFKARCDKAFSQVFSSFYVRNQKVKELLALFDGDCITIVSKKITLVQTT